MPTVKGIIRTAFHSTGGIHVARGLRRHALRILMYHRFSADTAGLKQQCEHIRRYYESCSLSLLSENLNTGDSLPPNALIVTVDDGYRDFFLYAYPVFREYEIPCTVFLVSDFVDQKSWLWWNKIEYAIQQTQHRSVTVQWPNGDFQDCPLETPQHRTQAINQIVERLITIENSERLKLLTAIPKMLAVELPWLPGPKWSALSWSEVKTMSRNGVEFGGHTKTHPILSRIKDAATLHEEIKGCKLRIEQELDQAVPHFCYPNGSLADFNEQIIQIVKDCGFKTAVTTERGLNYKDADPFRLRRIGVEPVGATPYFQELLAGLRTE
jgi:peptidoglycan/xylan/chitin deacetylase (PgdA/CDA1 family)